MGMSKIDRILSGFSRIGIDTSPFIYHFEAHPVYTKFTVPLFRRIEAGKVEAATTTITLMEVLVKPMREGAASVVSDYRYALNNFPNLLLMEIDSEVAERAAGFRAAYGLRPPDAIQLGGSAVFGAEAFITNDARLKKVKDMQILLVDDVLGVS